MAAPVGGARIIACAADLAKSTSVSPVSKAFAKGWFHAKSNPLSRLISVGGICEDAMGGVMAGASILGLHIGADGPTHACPQPLQLLQDNFPKGALITLTPWDPSEVWPLLMAGLRARPAVLAPFVTRPANPVPDRAKLGLPPASAATKGVYAVRRGGKATVVLQGHGVAHYFMRDVLPKLDAAGVKLNVFYVTSAELFDRLSDAEKSEAFPPEMAFNSMGITDFTLPTLWRWVRSDAGLAATLYPSKTLGYLGSGSGDKVFEQASLTGPGQLAAITAWVKSVEAK